MENLEVYLGQDFWMEVELDLQADYYARERYWQAMEEMDKVFSEWEKEDAYATCA